jgi:hypothetical protein
MFVVSTVCVYFNDNLKRDKPIECSFFKLKDERRGCKDVGVCNAARSTDERRLNDDDGVCKHSEVEKVGRSEVQGQARLAVR